MSAQARLITLSRLAGTGFCCRLAFARTATLKLQSRMRRKYAVHLDSNHHIGRCIWNSELQICTCLRKPPPSAVTGQTKACPCERVPLTPLESLIALPLPALCRRHVIRGSVSGTAPQTTRERSDDRGLPPPKTSQRKALVQPAHKRLCEATC